MKTLLGMPATELASAIARRDVRSVDVVNAHVAHARKVNPALNAIVVETYDQALEAAKEADALQDRGAKESLPPFHGVPCTIKECFAVTGLPHTAGLVARMGRPATQDATTVVRLREAGAISMGTTNTSELCMWLESSNRVYGRTNNPHDVRRIVGGSSGGEGAIVASGASPFGLGSDVGGSIRMPAFFNGVFGHKPTGGWVPATGQFPIAAEGASRYLTTGPLCRSARDLWPLMEILAGPDGQDPGCFPPPMQRPETVDLRKVRVLTMESNGRVPVSPALMGSIRHAAEALKEAGAHVEPVELPAFRHSLEIWGGMLNAAGGPSFRSMLGEGEPIPLGSAFRAWLRGASPHTLPALGLAWLEGVPAFADPKATAEALRMGRELQTELEALLGDDGVLLFPPYAEPAPRHGRPLLTPWQWVYTAIFNVLETPVTQVPAGRNPIGLPLGVQVVGSRNQDHLTVAVAQALEDALGGWVKPRSLVAAS